MYKKLLLAMFFSLFLKNGYSSRWSRTGDLDSARAGYMGAVLTDGRVMILGGDPYLGSFELFDPANGRWTTGALPSGASHTMGILLPNGKVLYINNSGASWFYDPFANSWNGATSFGTWYMRGCATLLKDGQVLTVGLDNSNPTKCVLYDYLTNTIIPTANTNYDHTFGAIEVLLPSGEVLIAGKGDYSNLDSCRKCEIYNPSSGSWTTVGDMNLGRRAFVGIYIPQPWNTVLAAGVQWDTVYETELYNPGSGTWSFTGNLNNPQRGVSAMVLLPSGKPIIIGGEHGERRCEIYDPVSGTWGLADSLIGRTHFSATVLHTGKVLVVSSYDGSNYTATCEIYDPSDGQWTTKSPISTSRRAHTITLLPIIHTSNCSTNVLIAGGESSSGYISSCELYNYIEETVVFTGALNTARAYHTANLLANSLVLVAGGTNGSGGLVSCETYDANTQTWTSVANMNNGRFNHTATLLSDGKVLVTGGESGTGTLSSCEVYDGTSWNTTSDMGVARRYHTAVMLLNRKVLVIGGENSSGALNSVEIWDPGTGSWSSAANLTTARYSHTAVLLQSGKVLVIGGKDGGGNPISSCELYDPSTNSWSFEANLNTARYLHTSILMYSGLVVIAGGFDGANYLADCEVYDPAIHKWKITGMLGSARAYHTACIIPDIQPYVLAIGGYNGSFLNSIEEYDVGLGYHSEWQSKIKNYQSVTHIGNPMDIKGELFRGVSEADGGNNCHIMSSDHPIISLLRIGGGNFQSNGGGEILYMPLSSSWSDTHTVVHPTIDSIQGYYALWSIVNGIPCKWYEECVPASEETQNSKFKTQVMACPNPSTGVVYIKFTIQDARDKVIIGIYDCSGRLVRKVSKNYTSSGDKEIVLNGLKSGVYFYSFNYRDFNEKGKFIVFRK